MKSLTRSRSCNQVSVLVSKVTVSSTSLTAMQSKASLLPIIYNFNVMLLLVNATFPSELCQ